jgi:antitoxin component of MazEF toxin-antitoxin module
MGEVTTLAKNSPNFASLRTTIPMNMVRQWNLKPGSKLDWSWEVVNGEMVIVVRRKEQKD